MAQKKPAEPEKKKGLARREFLKGGTLLMGAALAGCKTRTVQTLSVPPPESPVLPTADKYPEVPPTPMEPPPQGVFLYLTPHEAKTLDALTSRLLPGTPDDPGAHEAGVVTYIDHKLTLADGFAQPIYLHPPFAKAYEGPNPPAENTDHDVVWVPKDQLDRYGFQSSLNPRQMYRKGLAALDRYTKGAFGQDFATLSEAQQDAVIGQMEAGQIQTFSEPSSKDFFNLVYQDVIEGMFADPVYGGNRDMVGWKLVGYPGAQRAYTPPEVSSEGTRRQPQSIAQLPMFHPGEAANDDVTIPVSGFTLQHKP